MNETKPRRKVSQQVMTATHPPLNEAQKQQIFLAVQKTLLLYPNVNIPEPILRDLVQALGDDYDEQPM